MDTEQISKGDLFFLMVGDMPVFSGYGLAMQAGSKRHLVGLLMIDRPHRASPAWLAEVRKTFGHIDLHPMTKSGERGISCQLWIAPESVTHVRPMTGALAQTVQDALFPLLNAPPKPQFAMRWNAAANAWCSTLRTEDEPSSQTTGLLFELGTVVATPGALDALRAANQLPYEFLQRHMRGEWGDIDPEDWQANERALQIGQRLFSAYSTHKGTRLWLITEWDRSVTTLLLPSEY